MRGITFFEVEDKETKAKCRLYLDYAFCSFPHPEGIQRKALKQFMKACKEARRDKAHNHRRP